MDSKIFCYQDKQFIVPVTDKPIKIVYQDIWATKVEDNNKSEKTITFTRKMSLQELLRELNMTIEEFVKEFNFELNQLTHTVYGKELLKN